MIPAAMIAFGFLGMLTIKRAPSPSMLWRRWSVERELRELARYRRRLRTTTEEAERDYRANPAARDQLGRELAALVVLLVQCDERIDAALDRLDAMRPQ